MRCILMNSPILCCRFKIKLRRSKRITIVWLMTRNVLWRSSQVKASAELLQAAKEKLSKATIEANKQTMYRIAFGMLRKADPSYTEQDWANLAFNVKALVTDLLAKEMSSFLPNQQFNGLMLAPKLSTPV